MLVHYCLVNQTMIFKTTSIKIRDQKEPDLEHGEKGSEIMFSYSFKNGSIKR